MAKIVLTTETKQFVLETSKIVGLSADLDGKGSTVSFKGETGYVTTVDVDEPFDFIAHYMDVVRYEPELVEDQEDAEEDIFVQMIADVLNHALDRR